MIIQIKKITLYLITALSLLSNSFGMNQAEIYKFVHKETAAIQFTTITVDLNEDLVDETLIGVECIPGSSCIYYCFSDSAGNYRFFGTVYLNKSRFEVLKTRHNGYCDILSYEQKIKAVHSKTSAQAPSVTTESPPKFSGGKLSPREYQLRKKELNQAEVKAAEKNMIIEDKFDDKKVKGQGVLSRMEYNGRNYELRKSVVGRDDMQELLAPALKRKSIDSGQ